MSIGIPPLDGASISSTPVRQHHLEHVVALAIGVRQLPQLDILSIAIVEVEYRIWRSLVVVHIERRDGDGV